ncbi:YolD-like family protein [Staphylococcus sp. 11261D007BR]
MIVNPNVPEPYCYETDYRKIPRKYLNPNIPIGRGMVKWAPFATLPEQFETIKQFEADQLKIAQPELSETQMEDINYMLYLKMTTNELASIDYWRMGHIHTIQGYIDQIDVLKDQMTITNERRTDRIIIALSELYAIQ